MFDLSYGESRAEESGVSSESTRSGRVATNLVTQAEEAFARGEEDTGRRLLTQAARLYEQVGEPETAVELLASRGLTGSAIVMASRSGLHTRAAQLLGAQAENTHRSPSILPGPNPTTASLPEHHPLLPPLLGSERAEVAKKSSKTPSKEIRPAAGSDTQKPAEDDVASLVAPQLSARLRHESLERDEHDDVPLPALVDPSLETAPQPFFSKTRAPLSALEAWRRFSEACEGRRGRSPHTDDIQRWIDELLAARALRAEAYANHLERMIAQLDPHSSIPKAQELPVSVLEAAVSTDWAEHVEPASPLTRDKASEIEAAINEVVGEDVINVAEPEDSSMPVDLGPILAHATPSTTQDLTGGLLRGRFRLEEKIGRGAQAQVYLARDQVLDRILAIKVLSDKHVENPDALEGFLVEARLAAQVHHPGCLEVFDFGREGDLTFLAMEYFPGQSLRSLLRGSRLEVLLVLHIAWKLAEALEAVHAVGIVHRDVKPSNVLVDRQAQAKLMDFGVATRLDAEHEEGLMVGTIRYMAPEQAQGFAPDPRSDVFSLGALMWEMLVGRHAFEPSVEALKARITKEPPLIMEPQVPEEVVQIVHKCLQPRPEDRPSSAMHVAQALGRSVSRMRRERAHAVTLDTSSF